MILKDDFYTITELTEEEHAVRATLELNPEHRIFKGHFPGQPVVPGICMIQIIKEILQTVTTKSLMLKQSDYIKFLSVIDPAADQQVQADVQYSCKEKDEWIVAATLRCGERICFKLKAVFVLFLFPD